MSGASRRQGARKAASGEAGPWRVMVVAAVLVVALIGTIVVASVGLPESALPGDGHQTPGPMAEDDGVGKLHADGVVGENVTVGVVDPTGFDADRPALVRRVRAVRSFGDGSAGDGGHGTAAATVVARTAPAAELYLASFDSGDGFVAAVDWMVRRGVDVVVAPVGFYGKGGDGGSRVARAAAAATRNGVVFVAPSGNLGRSHWQGVFEPDEEGNHQFRGGPRNYLLGDGDRVTLWLAWPDALSGASFSVELYRTDGSTSRLVARSQPFDGDAVPNARIVADVDPGGTYYAVVRGPPSAAGTEVRLSSPTHGLQYRRRGGSLVAPGTAEPVVTVGAYDARRDRVAPFSSAGPVADGRPGVDVVAPGSRNVTAGRGEFEGSSAAAAHVAGLAALVLDVRPSLSPTTVEAVLRASARDVGSPGVDAASGAGLVDPWEAVARGRNATQSEA